MNLPASQLQRILNGTPKEFRLGDYISRGLKFMNDNFGMLLAFMLVSGVISSFLQIIPIAGIALSVLVTPVLQIGYAQFSYVVIRERRVEFGEFFKGFNKFGPLLATYLLTGIITLLAMLPGLILWYQAGMSAWLTELFAEYPFIESVPDLRDSVDMTLFWLGFLVMVAGALLVGTLFSWALFLVCFFDISPLDALNASRKLIARNWLLFIIFMIVAGLIAASGLLLCFVGILYTAPAMACAQFFAFSDATGILEDPENQEPDIIDHFIA